MEITEAGRLYLAFCKAYCLEGETGPRLIVLKTRVEGIVSVASIYSVGISEMSQLEENSQDVFRVQGSG